MADNIFVRSLAGTSMMLAGRDNTVTYHFDNTGSRAWTSEEKAGFRAALSSWADVANVTFEQVGNRAAADITEKLLSRDLMTILLAPGVTAYHFMPGVEPGPIEGGYSITGTLDDPNFNLNRYDVEAGSRNLQIFIHELGHALGLTHPHDTDLGTRLFPGVKAPSDKGAYGLNQNIYTVMSYNNFGTPSATTGHAATPMAFDIAAIQFLYGANWAHNAGNTTYTLGSPDAGAAWRCLWDGGGIDTLRYDGRDDATIDLRAATLKLGPHGGGYLSQTEGAKGGYTIAKGVIIENASGGSGSDRITGNGANNVLDGRGGGDVLAGSAGSDRLAGGSGCDVLRGGTASDILYGGSFTNPRDGDRDVFDFNDVAHLGATRKAADAIVGFEGGIDVIDLSSIDANTLAAGNQTFTFIGSAGFHGHAAELRLQAGAHTSVLSGDIDGDGRADFVLRLVGYAGLKVGDLIL